MAPSLDRRLLAHARTAGLFPKAGTALLAVSGGPDSVALLDLLHVIASDLKLTLAVAHVDHGILPESGAVAEQVRVVAGRYHAPAHISRLSLGAGATETRARRARYTALRAIQRRIDARYLVTAHHADDQLETILYRLLRGSGIGGLAAIRAVGPGGLVRPLLPFRRQELLDWLTARYPDASHRPPVHQDKSNLDERHDRSWVRQRVLPLLRERFGERLDQRLLDVAGHALSEREAWAALLKASPELGYRGRVGGAEILRAPLARYEPALAQALLRALARESGCRLGPRRSARLLNAVRRASSGRVLELGQGFVAEVAFDRLCLRRDQSEPVPEPAEWGRGNEGSVSWGAWELRWRREPAGAARRAAWDTWVEPHWGMVRGVARGDRLVPLGGTGHRGVSRLLMEARVPRSARAAYPVVVQGGGVLWLPGVCRSASGVPRPGEPSLRLEVRPGGVGAEEVVG